MRTCCGSLQIAKPFHDTSDDTGDAAGDAASGRHEIAGTPFSAGYVRRRKSGAKAEGLNNKDAKARRKLCVFAPSLF
jgi:hypothetical protein